MVDIGSTSQIDDSPRRRDPTFGGPATFGPAAPDVAPLSGRDNQTTMVTTTQRLIDLIASDHHGRSHGAADPQGMRKNARALYPIVAWLRLIRCTSRLSPSHNQGRTTPSTPSSDYFPLQISQLPYQPRPSSSCSLSSRRSCSHRQSAKPALAMPPRRHRSPPPRARDAPSRAYERCMTISARLGLRISCWPAGPGFLRGCSTCSRRRPCPRTAHTRPPHSWRAHSERCA